MRLRRVRRRQWDVLAVCSDRGDCQVLDFLYGLEGKLAKQRPRMLALLDRVAEGGPPSDAERSHKIAGAIWELIHGDLRILYFFDAGRLVICTTAFVKKSQKTPNDEVVRAEAAASRYQNAKKAGRVEVEEESE